MDVAVAILYCKSSNTIEKFSSPPESTDFEILLEDAYVPCAATNGGSFVPASNENDSAFCSSYAASTSSIFDRASSPLSSRENLGRIVEEDRRTSTTTTSGGRSMSPRSGYAESRTRSPINNNVKSTNNNARTSTNDGKSNVPVKLMKQLPRRGISFDQEPNEIAAIFASKLFSTTNSPRLFRRAVPVALWKSEPSSPLSAAITLDNDKGAPACVNPSTNHSLLANGLSAALFCVPVMDKDKIVCSCSTTDQKSIENGDTKCSCRYRFHPFEKVLSMCRNASSLIDPETRHLMLRLEEWIKVKSRQQAQFMSSLFVRSSAANRLGSCVHNPGHKSEICRKRPIGSTAVDPVVPRSTIRSKSSRGGNGVEYVEEVAEDVRSANTALACMMALEKCDRFVMNPLFGSGLPYRLNGHRDGQQLSPQLYQYVAKNRPEPSCLLRRAPLGNGSHQMNDGSDSGSFVDDFPLHRAAQMGQAGILKQLLAQHFDANQLDRDYWAPIHYASWYGQLASIQILLNYGQNCQVNIRNRNGSTGLHFAAWYGHQYVVELLLTHPDIALDLRDKDGKTALDLCASVPKPEWQAVADLLRTAAEKKRTNKSMVQHTPKVQVDLMDGSNAMLSLTDGQETTAEQLHAQMCRELQMNEECGRLFSIWICSESLQLQLRGDHKPMQHLQKWKSKLWQWSDIADSIEYEEKARLIFRRDARIGLRDEKKVKLTDTALALLFHEAHNNFLRGFYPCDDHGVVMLAATVMQILHGDFDSKRDKIFLSSENSLSKILPTHKLHEKHFDWVKHIMSEHKHLSSARTQNSLTSLQYRYLSFCEKFRVYGSAFFTAVMFVDKPVKGGLYVHAGINDAGLHLINCETKSLCGTFEYSNLAFTFQADRPFVKFRGKDNGTIHEFTLKTKQASMINTLLSRFADRRQQKPTNSSSSSIISEKSSSSVPLVRK